MSETESVEDNSKVESIVKAITELPLVTVNILSFNRKEELRHTLNKVYEQDYKNIEVIVVDNASSDGSAIMVEEEFPNVILIKLEKNIGIAGWNKGFEIAKGEYVLVLDDDAYPHQKSLQIGITEIVENSSIGAIAFNIIDINTNKMFWAGTWLPRNDIEETFWPVFVGCSVLIRGEIIKTAIKGEFFLNNIFLYQHELSASAIIRNMGLSIYYNKSIVAYHNCKNSTQYDSKIDQFIFRNNLLFIMDFLPRPLVPFYYSQLFIFYLIRSIRKDWYRNFLMTINNSFSSIGFQKLNRITYSYFLELRKLHLFNFPLVNKLTNFFV